jgi:glycosyltransferase involved in cell wall biosynthesis
MKNNKLTILTPYFPTQKEQYGGIFVYDQTKAFAKYVKQVDVYVTRPWFKLSRKFPFIASNRDDLSLIDIEQSNVKLNLIRYFPFPKDSIYYHLSLAISVFFNKHKFSNKLLVHTVYPLGAATQRLGLQSTIVIHGSDFRYFSKNPKQAKAIVNAVNNSSVVCVSKGLMQEVNAAAGVMANGAKISVVENGVLIPSVSNAKQVNIIDKNAFKFVFVGSLIKLKGVYELVEAFAKLQKKQGHEKHSLTFVGEGIEKDNLEEIIRKNSIRNVTFLGAVVNEKVMQILAEKDCLVLPSYQEGFGRVIIEMLSLGKPVIATKSGGPEFILNEQTGLIVPPKDIDSLVAAMTKMAITCDKYSPLILKEYVNKNYCIEKQTLKLLRNIEI